MSWIAVSNPVGLWWLFLLAVSALNIALLAALCLAYRKRADTARNAAFAIEPLLLLCAVYVLGCAFRSVLPRADVQRICLFDTALSSVLVGRSVATAAELCFVVQWAIVLHALGRLADLPTAKTIAKVIVPLIALAECCSWYAVITTNSLGNVLENSLWTVTFLLIGIALARLIPRFQGIVPIALAAITAGIAGYIVFMVAIDVPMYAVRWQAELASAHRDLGFAAGLHDLATRWIVTRDFARWRHEIPWMSLYFSTAVWASLALGGFPLIARELPRFRQRRPDAKALGRRVSLPLRSS